MEAVVLLEEFTLIDLDQLANSEVTVRIVQLGEALIAARVRADTTVREMVRSFLKNVWKDKNYYNIRVDNFPVGWDSTQLVREGMLITAVPLVRNSGYKQPDVGWSKKRRRGADYWHQRHNYST
jgi:hypothetical protein